MQRYTPTMISISYLARTAFGILLLAALAVSFAPASAQAQSCLSAAQTRTAIASGEIVQLSQIVAAAQARGYTQIGSALVCGSQGAYLYEVVASAANGRSARLTFNAASGALVSEF